MNDILSRLPNGLQPEWVVFGVVVMAGIFVGMFGLWLFREIAGQNVPSEEPFPRSPDEPLNDPTVRTGLIPTDREREQIEPELRQAGYYRPGALAEYKSVRALLVLLPLVGMAALALFVDRSRIPNVVIGGAILAALGYSVPRVYVATMARYRRQEIERGLPIAIDMIALGLLAGQNIVKAFRRVAMELRRSFPVLAEEMELTIRQAEMNTLGHALRVWAVRSNVSEVYNLSVILTQSERLGADVSNALLDVSATFRTTLRQRADAQANRAGFWMLFPTVLCMWIPAAVILSAPVYMEFQERRARAREALIPQGGDPNGRNLQERYAPFLQGTAPITPQPIPTPPDQGR